jgi:hypothetical protein
VVRHQPTSSNLGCPNSCPSFGLSVVDVSLRSGEVESSTDGRSGTRAATNEKRHTTNDKNHKATSPNKPSSTMVNKNLTFDPLPAEDIKLKVGTVAELNGIRYVTYYPNDQFIRQMSKGLKVEISKCRNIKMAIEISYLSVHSPTITAVYHLVEC